MVAAGAILLVRLAEQPVPNRLRDCVERLFRKLTDRGSTEIRNRGADRVHDRVERVRDPPAKEIGHGACGAAHGVPDATKESAALPGFTERVVGGDVDVVPVL